MDYPDPVWLLLNAEGTRFTEKKHEASIKFARDRGMVELKHHLIPRTKGFTSSLPELRNRSVILDIQLGISKDSPVKPTIFNILNGKSIESHMHVRRITFDQVPEDEEKAAEWLQELFRQKDIMQESFHKHGDFFTGSNIVRKVPIKLQPRLHTLINMVAWNVITVVPMTYYLIQLLVSGEIMYFSIGTSILVAFYGLMVRAIGMSKISKASSYGSEKKNEQHRHDNGSPTNETTKTK